MGKAKFPSLPSEPPVLVLAGVEGRIQVVLAADGVVLSARELAVAGSANQHLAPAIAGVLADFGLAAGELAGVACVRGPGGFTGVRMLLATGLGLAQAARLPMAGLDHLPLLAAGPAPLVRGPLAVVTHARTRQVYVQIFHCPAGEPLGPPRPLGLDEAASALAEAGAVAALGSGLRRHEAFFREALPGLDLLPEGYDTPMPHVLARAAQAAAYGHEPVEPLYLRASDAEENLANIAAGRGLDPKEAKRRLDEATSRVAAPSCKDGD